MAPKGELNGGEMVRQYSTHVRQVGRFWLRVSEMVSSPPGGSVGETEDKFRIRMKEKLLKRRCSLKTKSFK